VSVTKKGFITLKLGVNLLTLRGKLDRFIVTYNPSTQIWASLYKNCKNYLFFIGLTSESNPIKKSWSRFTHAFVSLAILEYECTFFASMKWYSFQKVVRIFILNVLLDKHRGPML